MDEAPRFSAIPPALRGDHHVVLATQDEELASRVGRALRSTEQASSVVRWVPDGAAALRELGCVDAGALLVDVAGSFPWFAEALAGASPRR